MRLKRGRVRGGIRPPGQDRHPVVGVISATGFIEIQARDQKTLGTAIVEIDEFCKIRLGPPANQITATLPNSKYISKQLSPVCLLPFPSPTLTPHLLTDNPNSRSIHPGTVSQLTSCLSSFSPRYLISQADFCRQSTMAPNPSAGGNATLIQAYEQIVSFPPTGYRHVH